MRLIDCHAHLGDPMFDEDRNAVLQRARDAGVEAVVIVGETVADAVKNLDLARQYPELLPAAGLYPTYLDHEQAERMEALIRENRDRLVAIGEVGLDFWKIKEPDERETQRRIFGRFIRLASELDLPLNVHSRSAGRATVAMLVEAGARRVQLHAFDGRIGSAAPAVEAGYFFSIPASVARSRQKQRLVRHLPVSCLLLETDSPVLSPVAGERNEPANTRIALQSVARLRDLEETELAAAVERNTRRLYGKIDARPQSW